MDNKNIQKSKTNQATINYQWFMLKRIWGTGLGFSIIWIIWLLKNGFYNFAHFSFLITVFIEIVIALFLFKKRKESAESTNIFSIYTILFSLAVFTPDVICFLVPEWKYAGAGGIVFLLVSLIISFINKRMNKTLS